MFTVKKIAAFLLMLVCGGCVRLPDGIEPVTDFNLERYLGTWYEIARLDHSFERGLSEVTAEYSLREDGGINVVNRGFDTSSGKWRVARGKAYFVDASDVGRLKVSFFGPFYGGYNIIELDRENYAHALVCGPNRSYLWILSRLPRLDPAIMSELVSRAGSLGFRTDDLIYVKHTGIDLSQR